MAWLEGINECFFIFITTIFTVCCHTLVHLSLLAIQITLVKDKITATQTKISLGTCTVPSTYFSFVISKGNFLQRLTLTGGFIITTICIWWPSGLMLLCPTTVLHVTANLVPRISYVTAPWGEWGEGALPLLSPGCGKTRDPENEVALQQCSFRAKIAHFSTFLC